MQNQNYRAGPSASSAAAELAVALVAMARAAGGRPHSAGCGGDVLTAHPRPHSKLPSLRSNATAIPPAATFRPTAFSKRHTQARRSGCGLVRFARERTLMPCFDPSVLNDDYTVV